MSNGRIQSTPLTRSVRARSRPVQGRSLGFSLVELMVAMLLGLVVIAGVISVFLSNQRVYRTSQALGDVQDGSRFAFEMLSRDIRAAGMTGCNKGLRMSNVLTNGPNGDGSAWWADTSNALHGYAGSQTDPALAASNQVAGTDSLQVVGAAYSGLSVATNDQGASTFTLHETNDSLKAGDVLVVCDEDHTAIFQSTDYSPTTKTITYATGSGSPGNFTSGLGYPTSSSSASSTYTYGSNAQIAELSASDWYIGTNDDGGTSLYRMSLSNTAGTVAPQSQEMVRNVASMVLEYHQSGDAAFGDATTITNWGSVDAVRVTLELQSANQRAGTDNKPVTRKFTATTTVRNRVP